MDQDQPAQVRLSRRHCRYDPPSRLGRRRIERPKRTPTAIRAELPADLRAKFDAQYQAALDAAKSTYRLDRLNEAIEGGWLTVWARRSPVTSRPWRPAGGSCVASQPRPNRHEPEPHGR
jgi:hypothetical protein